MVEPAVPGSQHVGSNLSSSFIGVDAGGSSTRAVLLNAQGVVVRCATAPAGNPHVSVSNAGVLAVLSAIRNVLRGESLATVIVALSGGDDSKVVSNFERAIRAACLFSTTTRLVVCHDVAAPAGLVISAKQPFCAVLIAGTGSVAAGFYAGTPITLLSRAGGRGPLVGDEGSAHAIATEALAHALRIFDGMSDNRDGSDIHDANEVLREAIAAFDIHLSLLRGCQLEEGDVSALVTALHAEESTRTTMAGLAARFAPLATKGNTIVNQAFANAGSALSLLVRTVVTRGFPPIVSDVPVVVAGGVFDAWNEVPAFRTAFNSALHVLPGRTLTVFRLSPPQHAPDASPAAIGAACLGALLVDVDNPLWQQLFRECLEPLRMNGE